MKKEYASLESELAAYGACDPVVVEQKQRAVLLTHEAAIRWTGASSFLSSVVSSVYADHSLVENFSTALQWFRNQNPYVEMEQIREMLGISEEYEDIE